MGLAPSIWKHGEQIAAWIDLGMLFTDVAARWSGEEIIACTTERTGRVPLTAVEHRDLETWRDGTCGGHRREGTLVTASGRRAARVSSVYLASRIPDESVTSDLQCTDIPLGKALSALGVKRRVLSCSTRSSGPFAVEASGLLLLDGIPVAMAKEQVFREFAAERS